MFLAFEDVADGGCTGENRLFQRVSIRPIQCHPKRSSDCDQADGQPYRKVRRPFRTTQQDSRVHERSSRQPPQVTVNVLSDSQWIERAQEPRAYRRRPFGGIVRERRVYRDMSSASERFTLSGKYAETRATVAAASFAGEARSNGRGPRGAIRSHADNQGGTAGPSPVLQGIRLQRRRAA